MPSETGKGDKVAIIGAKISRFPPEIYDDKQHYAFFSVEDLEAGKEIAASTAYISQEQNGKVMPLLGRLPGYKDITRKIFKPNTDEIVWAIQSARLNSSNGRQKTPLSRSAENWHRNTDESKPAQLDGMATAAGVTESSIPDAPEPEPASPITLADESENTTTNATEGASTATFEPQTAQSELPADNLASASPENPQTEVQAEAQLPSNEIPITEEKEDMARKTQAAKKRKVTGKAKIVLDSYESVNNDTDALVEILHGQGYTDANRRTVTLLRNYLRNKMGYSIPNAPRSPNKAAETKPTVATREKKQPKPARAKELPGEQAKAELPDNTTEEIGRTPELPSELSDSLTERLKMWIERGEKWLAQGKHLAEEVEADHKALQSKILNMESGATLAAEFIQKILK